MLWLATTFPTPRLNFIAAIQCTLRAQLAEKTDNGVWAGFYTVSCVFYVIAFLCCSWVNAINVRTSMLADTDLMDMADAQACAAID